MFSLNRDRFSPLPSVMFFTFQLKDSSLGIWSLRATKPLKVWYFELYMRHEFRLSAWKFKVLRAVKAGDQKVEKRDPMVRRLDTNQCLLCCD